MENGKANTNPLVNVIVTYGYTAAEQDELSLRPGDIIRSVERLAGGWWRGELNGRMGLFPDNFVRVVGASQEMSNDVTLRGRSSCPRYCRALFSYQQANPDELSLSVGDIIQVLGEEEEGWWRGQLGNLRGVFPSNFVEPIDSSHAPPPVLPPKPVREQCRVIFPYTAANMDELSLVEGDLITILSKDVPDQGWWLGELKGRKGLFPDNFVQLLPLPALPGSDLTNKKPSRPAKNIGTPNKSPSSVTRKDSTSSKSSVNSTPDNISSASKSLDMNDSHLADQSSSKFKKSTESLDSSSEGKPAKTKKPESEIVPPTEGKPRKSLEVEGGKPPIPSKKASSPVSAVLSGIKQRFSSGHQQPAPTPPASNDTADGLTSSKLTSGEPVLRSISPSPSHHTQNSLPINNINSSPLTSSTENFDNIERTSMLNDPRASRVKAPRRRPPSQAMREDGTLTNGNATQAAPTEVHTEEIIKPRAREWEKHKVPWMDELKSINQAKKISPIAEIGRSKTISSSESNASEKIESHYARLSGSSDKILESTSNATDDSKTSVPIEMSQSMHALSTTAVKMDASDEVQTVSENVGDNTKTVTSISTKSSHSETNNKVSATELRTSISSSASVVLRSKVFPNPSPSPVPSSAQSNASDSSSILNSLARFSTTSSERDNSTTDKMSETSSVKSLSSIHSLEKERVNHNIHSNGEITEIHPVNGTPEQILIAQLNERVANLEKVVEAQEERFSSALSDLKKQLMKETEARISLQAEVHKLERCVTNV